MSNANKEVKESKFKIKCEDCGLEQDFRKFLVSESRIAIELPTKPAHATLVMCECGKILLKRRLTLKEEEEKGGKGAFSVECVKCGKVEDLVDIFEGVSEGIKFTLPVSLKDDLVVTCDCEESFTVNSGEWE